MGKIVSVQYTAPKVALCLDPDISGPFVVIDEQRVSLDQIALEGGITQQERGQFGWVIYKLQKLARQRQVVGG